MMRGQVCQYPSCDVPAIASCDNCIDNNRFCSDHGTKGGDRETEDVGMVAVPSLCWKCGGFDADEEFPEGKKAFINELMGGLRSLAQ